MHITQSWINSIHGTTKPLRQSCTLRCEFPLPIQHYFYHDKPAVEEGLPFPTLVVAEVVDIGKRDNEVDDNDGSGEGDRNSDDDDVGDGGDGDVVSTEVDGEQTSGGH